MLITTELYTLRASELPSREEEEDIDEEELSVVTEKKSKFASSDADILPSQIPAIRGCVNIHTSIHKCYINTHLQPSPAHSQYFACNRKKSGTFSK
jgi:hypothetical protein